MILELARGAKPELFTSKVRGGKKGKVAEKVPLTGGTISALKVFLPGAPRG